MKINREEGFSLVELLVAIGLFSVLSISFYGVMFAGVRGSTRSESAATISEEARLGFNRLIRDTREASRITAADEDSYTIEIDFDGVPTTAPVSETFSVVGDELRLQAETLIDGVLPVTGTDVFEYSSNRLEWDADGDGVTDQAELEQAVSSAVDGVLSAAELTYVSNVEYRFRVTDGEGDTEFVSQAQLRNRRTGA